MDRAPESEVDLLLAHAFGPRPVAGDRAALDVLLRQGRDWTQAQLAQDAPPAGDAATGAALVMGRYRVAGTAGAGGVGLVLRARDTTLARDVALKVLRTRHQGSQAMVDRFLEEAQIGAQLQHPGIVPVHDVGLLDDQRPFFTMKLIDGRTLAAVLAERARPDAGRARLLEVFQRVCETLAYAHARGVIHRDLKPSNVMVGAFGEVLVTDWGMAKVLTAAPAAASPPAADVVATTRSAAPAGSSVVGSVFGTPGYMAPEQARGQVDALGPPADVFALGAILCEILTGRPAFTGEREAALVQARLGDTREAVAALQACGAEADVIALAVRCLAPDPGARPASAQEVAQAMAAHAHAMAARAQAAQLALARAEARVVAERRARRLAHALVAVVVVTGLGLAAGAWWIDRTRSERVERTARAVDAALGEARRHVEGDAVAIDWAAATAAAERGVALAESGDADTATRERARSFAATVRTRADAARALAAQAESDRALLAQIDAVRILPARDLNWTQQDGAWQELFASLGVGGGMEPGAVPALAQRLGQHRLVRELVAALDDWSNCRRLMGDHAAARALSDLAQAMDPDPLRCRARSLIQAPDRNAARQLAAMDPKDLAPTTLLLLFRALQAAGEAHLGLELLRRGVGNHPDAFWLALTLSREARRAGDRLGAIQGAAAALALRPDSLGAGPMLALELAEGGQPAASAALLQRLLVQHPGDALLLTNLAASLHAAGQSAAAISVLEQLAARGPLEVTALYTGGRALRALGRREQARQWLERAIAADPRFSPARVALGALLCDDLHDLPAALATFAAACAVDPGNAEAHYDRALVCDKLGRPEQSLAACQDCVRVAPNHVRAWELLAVQAHRAGQPVVAYEAAVRAVALDPGLANIWLLIANSRGALGERKLSIAALRQAVQLKPDYAEAWHNLGIDLRAQPETRGEAIDAFRRAIAARPESALSHGELAVTLLEDDQREAAESAAREALRLDPAQAQGRAVMRALRER